MTRRDSSTWNILKRLKESIKCSVYLFLSGWAKKTRVFLDLWSHLKSHFLAQLRVCPGPTRRLLLRSGVFTSLTKWQRSRTVWSINTAVGCHAPIYFFILGLPGDILYMHRSSCPLTGIIHFFSFLTKPSCIWLWLYTKHPTAKFMQAVTDALTFERHSSLHVLAPEGRFCRTVLNDG